MAASEPLAAYRLGVRRGAWQEGAAKNITFIVTQDCQLRCRYCYLIGKNALSKMPFDIAQRTVDYVLRERALFREPSVIWDFIGGEPFLEVDLIDRISDYIKIRMYELEHPWFDSYRFNFATNGLLYRDSRVQRYIEKNRNHVVIGISIDGTRDKHDLNRVYSDGEGSYDKVLANIPLWLAQFPNGGTKATISHDDLPYLKESVVHLWSLGIKDVNMNVVFEDAWKEGDDEVYEAQLLQLADYIIEHQSYVEYDCTLFSENIGRPLDPVREDSNWCGAGKTLAVDASGSFYPCLRFAPFSLETRPPIVIGDCFTGINLNRLRPFLALNRVAQSSEECVRCDVASGCAWCQGVNYDCSDTGTIYQRATYLCKMHKARVRANRYYWQRLREKLRSGAGVA